MESWSCKCSICGWRFTVDAIAKPLSIPGYGIITVPPHDWPGRGVACAGSAHAGIGV